MKKTIKRSLFIKSTIIFLAVIMLLTIWPLRLYRRDIVYANPPITDGMSLAINYRNTASQVFIANHDHLQNIKLLIGDGSRADYFDMELTDSKGKRLALEQRIKLPEQLPGYVDLLMDVDVVPGELYTLKLKSTKSLFVGQEPWYNAETVAVSYYNDVMMEKMNLVMDYCYREPLTLGQNMLFVGIILLAVAVSLSILILVSKKHDKDITLERGAKCIFNPLTAIIMVACFVCIGMGLVSEYAPDNIMAVIGVIFFGIIAFYGINHKREGQEGVVTFDYFKDHIGDLVQSVAIAGAIQGCCEYVAGLYDIHHRVAERKEMLCFAIIIIAMFSAKELFSLYNLIYVVIAGVAGIIYYTNNISEDMTPDDLFVLRMTIVIVILTGMIVLRTIMAFVSKKKLPKVNLPYVIVTGIYLSLIVIFRNERWWTVVLTVALILLFITYGLWDKKERFLVNVIYGVVIQFVLCTIWCWMYRPYSTYGTARFPYYFHTETIAATYLSTIAVVATVLLLMKIRKTVIKRKNREKGKAVVFGNILLRNIWKELLFFGMVMSYIIFTMARTAYFSIIVALLFALFLMLFGYGKQSIKAILQTIGYMVLSVIIVLPVVFELQRTIPCLVSNPVEYEIEAFQDEIMRGRQLSALQYMTVGRFGNVFCEKILGIEDAGLDDYYDSDYTFDLYNATMQEIKEGTGFDWRQYEVTDDMWDERPSEEMFLIFIHDTDPAVVNGTDTTTETVTKTNETNQALSDNLYISQKVGVINKGYKSVNAVPVIALKAKAIEELPEDIEDEYAAEDDIVEEDTSDEDGDGMVTDYTNGRLDIFKSYIEQMNMTGHEGMGALLKDGSIATHAHDVYLQVAYDHGIPTGIIFVVFGIFSLVTSVIYYNKNKNKEPQSALTPAMIAAFAIAGLVEWTYHLSHPMTLVLWLSITPLIFKKDKRK